MRIFCITFISMVLLLASGCKAKPDVAPSVTQEPKITPSFVDIESIDMVDSDEPVWLEVESALLYRANLESPTQQNAFGLYYDEGDGFAYFHIDMNYALIAPFVAPRSLVQLDMDTSDSFIELVLCVAQTDDIDYTYVFRLDGQIVTLFEGVGTLVDVSGNTLTLSTGEYIVDTKAS
ncbi:MAG: hypothetical protein PHT58_02700 [Eubacteriales bacterium]|nr:hypothetical protein [Eubacteriales bacterium]